jgi:hypothetical protein
MIPLATQSNPALWIFCGCWGVPLLLALFVGWYARGRKERYERMKREGLIAAFEDEQ